MDKVHVNSERAIPLRENFATVSSTEKENSSGLTEQSTRENSETMRSLEWVAMTGRIAVTTRDKSLTVSDTARVATRIQRRELYMRAIGRTASDMAKEY